MPKEINGYAWANKRQVGSFKELKGDGSTACDCWIYASVFPGEGRNRARSRRPEGRPW